MSATTFRVATFNVENLFARYRFKQNEEVYVDDGFTINQMAFDIYNEAEKRVTAQAIKEVNADIMCLQEVESLPVLDRLKSRFLAKSGYDHRILVDCFDPRHIDVAVLSRFPVTGIRTYRHLRSTKTSASLFSRDCLEVDFDIKGKPFSVYVNHFKSMIGGRKETRERRLEQVKKVREIIENRWGKSLDGSFAVLGDFNDYVDAQTSLSDLLDHKHLVNVVERLPKKEQWTHFYAGKKEYRQLDYVLLPKALDGNAGKPTPDIMRKGLPHRAEAYAGPRFDDVGDNDPKSSDHCPVAVDIPFAAL